jgi:dipeptidyl aminopeptidase/acylaminoacyl peptidase
VYSAGGSLYGVAFDPVRLELRGYPVPLVHDVVSKSSGAASFGVSRSGSLVYVPGRLPGFQPRTLAWVDRDGAEEPLPADPRGYSRARVQPDGRRLALEVREPEPERLVWDLEGERLQPALAALSDGARAVASRPVATSGDADVPAPVGTEGASALTGSDGAAGAGTLSPDGRWIAFESDERGRPEVFVREAAESSEQASQVTTSGGRHPLWSPAGDELFYVDLDGAMMAVDIETDPSFSAGEPHELFRGPYLFDRAERPFDISPDGERFLVIRQDDSLPPLAFDIVIVEGWADHLSTLPSLR